MMDENNLTHREQEGREVVSWYVPPEKGEEVVRYYVQPRPLPESVRPRAEAAPVKKKKKGRTIFVILAAVLAVIIGVTALLVDLLGSDDTGADDNHAGSIVDISSDDGCHIPAADLAPEVRLNLVAPGEQTLTAVDVFQKMSPSTVTVLATNAAGKSFMGTGVLLTADGYFLTNAHVVEKAVGIKVVLDNGEEYSASLIGSDTYEAKLVGYDAGQDIAVLKAVDAEDLTPAEFCDSDYCMVGETVYAIGNPLNLSLRGTFTSGILSGLERQMEMDGKTLTMLQTNAAVNNGNSGGPLINAYGQVIGIVTMKMSQSGTGAEATVEGLGFALPTSQVSYVVNDILATGEYAGVPTFGFTIMTEYDESGESYVSIHSVEEGLPAQAAGVQPGDILVAADDCAIHNNWDLMDYRRQLRVGDTVDLTLLRNGEEIHCQVTLTATK